MIDLIPYSLVNGQWTIPDQAIAEIYRKMVSDGTLDTVFIEKRLSRPEDLLAMLKDRNNLSVLALYNGEPSGLFWINGIRSNYAMGHFCCFQESWGKHSKEIAEKVIEYWFSFPGERGPLFDVLIGMIPEHNERAINFVQQLGFNRVGTIPKMVNKTDSMVILYRLRT